MVEILLDTNFLLLPGEYHVDIFAEIKRIVSGPYEVVVLDRTLDELHTLIDLGKPRQKPAARIAVGLLKKHSIRVIGTDGTGHVDKLIRDYAFANKGDIVVATQDSELKKTLAKKHIPLIVMRKKQYLELLGGLY